MWYADINEFGKPEYRFAMHPTFLYWAFNQLQRLETLSDINLNIRYQSIDEKYTLERIKEMVKNNDPEIK